MTEVVPMQPELNKRVCDLLAGVTAKNRQPMLDYLEKHGEEEFVRGASFRTEEPLKGYRQWVFDALCERYRQSTVGEGFYGKVRKEEKECLTLRLGQ